MTPKSKNVRPRGLRAVLGAATAFTFIFLGCASGDETQSTTSSSATSTTTQVTLPDGGVTGGTHERCGWIGADTADAGKASFAAHPDYFQAIHPKWYTLKEDGTPRAIAFTDDAEVTKTARDHKVKLIPLIDADSGDYVRAISKSSDSIDRHVQQLVDLAVTHDYDGLELDYEHLWNKADRAGYLALIQAAAAGLHAKGKLITVAIPAMDHDDGNNAYDYATINAAVDVVHLMAYDFHYLGGDHMGPIAPLGWVKDVAKRAASIGDPTKYVMGVANYAISKSWYGPVPDAIAKCGGSYESQTDHMASCPYGAREAGLSPHCSALDGLWFEDAASISEKVQVAAQAGLGGVGYWTVGNEPSGFFETVQAVFR